MHRKREALSQLPLEEIANGRPYKKSYQNFECVQSRAGTILRIVLKNVMCHTHLEVCFDNNINYVIGRNGSGKSAILTALVIGLGGKASLTNRGNSIKGFIKAGKNSASVEVTIRNDGPMAYKVNTFGREITIARSFTISGTSSYKIKSENGEIISTKLKDIQSICTSLNIQVDNPICLLNQDTSRNFLSSNDPRQKFILFMRATHLQDLLDEYKKLLNNKNEAMKMLREKEGLYSNLRKALQELQKKVENYKSINNLKDRMKYLQREFCWAKVKDSEEDMLLQQQVVQNIEEEVTSIQGDITSLTERCSKIDENIQELQQKVNDLQESVEFQNGPQNALVRALGELKDTYNTKRREKQVVLKDIALKTGNCTMLQQEIDSIKENFSQLEQEQAQRLQKITSLEEKLRGIQGLLETSKNDQYQMRNSLEHLQEKEYNLKSEVQQINVQIDKTTSKLNNLQGSNNSILSLYGQNMPRIIEAINAAKSKFVHLPRGPLGSYITLKDKKWAVAVEGFLGAGLLRAFAVDNKEDNELLMSIFQRLWSGGTKPMVITSRFFVEVHDVSSNIIQPVGSCISIYSALEISDPIVTNCLIDQTSLESVLLIPDTNTAIELMADKSRVPKNCIQGITITGDKYYPDPNYKTYGSRYHSAQFLQVSTTDMMMHLKQKLKELNESKGTTAERHQTIVAELKQHSQQMNELEIKVTKLHRAQLHLKSQLDSLKSEAVPDIANVETLENELAELKQVLEQRQEIQQKIEGDIHNLNQRIDNSEGELEKIKKVCRGYEERIEPLEDQIREQSTLSKQHQTNKRFITKRLQEIQEKLNDSLKTLDAKTEIVTKHTQEATRVGERVETNRTVPIIIEDLNATQRSITQIESEVESVEELTKKYQITSEKYKKASEFMKCMCEDVKDLQIATDKSVRYYKHTEDYFISYVKHSFQKVLELRQFQGNIEIDIENKKLDLIVIPQQGSQGYTTTSNLSGGERSFSTVAFLYSLWQCMEFPFYFLDEFDVFMDKVNRTKVMEILLHHAKSRPDLQFVFLTPQDISFVNDKAVTIHRLEDPERAKVNGN